MIEETVVEETQTAIAELGINQEAIAHLRNLIIVHEKILILKEEALPLEIVFNASGRISNAYENLITKREIFYLKDLRNRIEKLCKEKEKLEELYDQVR